VPSEIETEYRRRIEPCRPALLSLLRAEGVNYHRWGEDTHLTFEDLLTALESKEMVLEERGHGKPPILTVRTTVVRVKHADPDKGVSELYEESQCFPQIGRTLQRDPSGIEEVRKKSESSLDSAIRGLREALGQTEPRFQDPKNFRLGQQPNYQMIGPQDSDDWPGLQTVCKRMIYLLEIPSALFHEEYVKTEERDGKPVKITTFEWRPVSCF